MSCTPAPTPPEACTPNSNTAAAHVSAETFGAKLAELYKDSGIGSLRALAAKLAPLTGDERAQAETRLYAVTRDHPLVQRLLPFYRIIRQDLRGDPVVILPGALYVTESALRASTGTHYTPRFLAEQVAEGALEPLVYSPGPLQTADRSAWKLRSAEEILSLRVADIAMGSGAFLVAACRYMAGKLIEAWSVTGQRGRQAAIGRASGRVRPGPGRGGGPPGHQGPAARSSSTASMASTSTPWPSRWRSCPCGSSL